MNIKYKVDVCVVGGGAAGVSAAISAKNAGAKVLLLERNPYFGGQATHSNVTAYCGFYTRGENFDQVVKGFGQTVLERLRKYGDPAVPYRSPATGNVSVRFDPETVKLVMDDLIEESGIDFLLHTRVINAEVEDNDIKYITCIDDEETYLVEAKSFIDCSGDANLAHLAGLETVWGNEEGKTQMASLSCRVDRLPAMEEINPKDLTKAIIEGKEEGRPYLFKEKGLIIKVPSEDYGFLTIPSVFVNDLKGSTLTKKEIELRHQALSYVELFKEKIPYLKDMRLVSTGPMLGARETRRIIGESTLLYEHVMECQKPSDSVARGGWTPEIHKDEKNYDFYNLPDNDYFGIPLSVLRSKDLNNLWMAGRIISTDSYTHGSVRVMGTGFATGQASGVAAALQSKNNMSIEKVQQELLKQGALI